jgi:hypothetical protein
MADRWLLAGTAVRLSLATVAISDLWANSDIHFGKLVDL